MVRTRSDRAGRRPQGAGPERPASRNREDDGVGLAHEKYPNMRAQQEMDRHLHIKAAREMGATREQASRHADEEVGGH